MASAEISAVDAFEYAKKLVEFQIEDEDKELRTVWDEAQKLEEGRVRTRALLVYNRVNHNFTQTLFRPLLKLQVKRGVQDAERIKFMRHSMLFNAIRVRGVEYFQKYDSPLHIALVSAWNGRFHRDFSQATYEALKDLVRESMARLYFDGFRNVAHQAGDLFAQTAVIYTIVDVENEFNRWWNERLDNAGRNVEAATVATSVRQRTKPKPKAKGKAKAKPKPTKSRARK